MSEVCLSGLNHSASFGDEPLVQIDLSDFALERSVGLLLPQLVAERLEGVCIHRLQNDRLLVAVAEANCQVSQSIELSWGYQCELVEASPEIIQLARKFIYGVLPDSADDETWIQWLHSQAGRSDEPASYLEPRTRVELNAGHLQQNSATSRGLSESALRRRLAKSA